MEKQEQALAQLRKEKDADKRTIEKLQATIAKLSAEVGGTAIAGSERCDTCSLGGRSAGCFW